MTTIGLPGLLLLLASAANPAGIVPGALFIIMNGPIILIGMT